MARIEGPDGRVANVSEQNKLEVQAVSQEAAQALNLAGLVFALDFSVTPVGAGDYCFYLQNAGTQDLAIGAWSATSDTPTRVVMDVVTGVPSYTGETAISPVNLNLGSSVPLQAVANYDTNITGLTSGGVLSAIECAVADTEYSQDIQSSIIVPQGKAVAVRRVEAAGQLDIGLGIAVVAI